MKNCPTSVIPHIWIRLHQLTAPNECGYTHKLYT
jgi:hypothetical protein